MDALMNRPPCSTQHFPNRGPCQTTKLKGGVEYPYNSVTIASAVLQRFEGEF